MPRASIKKAKISPEESYVFTCKPMENDTFCRASIRSDSAQTERTPEVARVGHLVITLSLPEACGVHAPARGRP